jgi:hypothetical protein
MRPWADNRKWPCGVFAYGDAGLAVPQFRIPIIPGNVFPGLWIEDYVRTVKNPVGRGFEEIPFKGPGLQIRRTINHQRAIKCIVIPICAKCRSVQVKAPAKELKATAMGVNGLPIDVKARVHIADRHRLAGLAVLRLAGARNGKNRDKTDKYFRNS